MSHHDSDPRVRQAITSALLVMAERLPELEALPDPAMIRLEIGIEEALAQALKVKDAPGA